MLSTHKSRAGQAARISVFLCLGLAIAGAPIWAQSGTVTGMVVDPEGDPLPGVLVSLEDSAGNDTGDIGTTDADGNFSISGVDDGTYTASAMLEGFESSTATVELADGGSVSVDLQLSASYHDAVLVTAERVEKNILETPMTITAFDSGMLEELAIQNNNDLQLMTPGLEFGESTEQDGQGTVIRGIGTRQAYYQHNDFAVATYVDGAYTIGQYGVDPGAGFDLERIEVARGPQGTLNGRNSIAGAINLVTKRPTTRWDAEIMGEVTDVSQQRLNAAIGGPLGGEVWSWRLTGGIHTGDGRQENVGPGGNYDKPDRLFYAPQIRAQTQRFSLNLRYSRVEDEGTPSSLVQLSNLDRTDPTFQRYYLWETPNPAIPANCPLGTPGFNCGDLENRVALNFPGSSESESDWLTLNASLQASSSLNVSYNYSNSDVANVTIKDSDYTNRVPIAGDHTIASDGLVSPFDNVSYRLPFEYDEQTHELQFTSSFGGRFNFIGGLFYYENERGGAIDRHDLAAPFRFGTADEQAIALSPVFGFLPITSCEQFLTDVVRDLFGIVLEDPATGLLWYCPEGSDHSLTVNFFSISRTKTEAAYFSGDYAFNDKWRLSGGLRYTEDEKEQLTSEQGGHALLSLIGTVVGVTFSEGEGNELPQTWSKPIGHLALEYSTDGGDLLYGRLSTGFRSGGFNIGLPGQVPPFIEEETLVNYEIGWKGLFAQNRLQLSTGLWYNDFQGYQLAATQEPPPNFPIAPFSDTPLAEFTTNIDDTEIYGLDFEFSWWATDHWRFNGFYAYQDSEIGPHASVILADPNPTLGMWEHIEFDTGETIQSPYVLATDQTGNQLPMQPEHKLSLTGSYNRQIGSDGGYLQLRGTYAHTGDRFVDIGNIPLYTLPAYDRIDLGASWTPKSDQFTVSLFLKNLADEIAVVEFLPISGNGGNPALGSLTHQREFALQLRWRPFG